MWIIFAVLAAIFSGLTTVFAKVGVTKANSTLVTGLRTIVILIFSVIVFIFLGDGFKNLNLKTIFFIVLSGLTTALLWICYFKALSLADVSMVTPIDKLSIVVTLILSFFFLKEEITIIKIVSMIFMISGTFLMVNRKEKNGEGNWFIYALLTALFTSLATILGKIGIKDINPNLGTMLRTIIILIIIWGVIFVKKEYKDIKNINKKNILFIILSGISTGLSWLFYFMALKEGEASIVFPIEKLSAAVAILISVIFLKEKLNKKGKIGFTFIISGTLLLILTNMI